jgi:anti-sigma regulatory factor (Ser/Thr protein kinase)
MARPEAHRRGPYGPGDADPAEMTVIGSITLPGTDRAVAEGRRFVRETLGPRHPSLDGVGLSVSELATNAIRHSVSGAGGRFTISLVAARNRVRAEVTDDGTTGSEPRLHGESGPDAEHGRGLVLIEALADRWGVDRDGGRTTVWAEFRH